MYKCSLAAGAPDSRPGIFGSAGAFQVLKKVIASKKQQQTDR
jgi:hypothetical protein